MRSGATRYGLTAQVGLLGKSVFGGSRLSGFQCLGLSVRGWFFFVLVGFQGFRI